MEHMWIALQRTALYLSTEDKRCCVKIYLLSLARLVVVEQSSHHMVLIRERMRDVNLKDV